MAYDRHPQRTTPQIGVAEEGTQHKTWHKAEKLEVERAEHESGSPHRQVSAPHAVAADALQRASEKHLLAKSGQQSDAHHRSNQIPHRRAAEQRVGGLLRGVLLRAHPLLHRLHRLGQRQRRVPRHKPVHRRRHRQRNQHNACHRHCRRRLVEPQEAQRVSATAESAHRHGGEHEHNQILQRCGKPHLRQRVERVDASEHLRQQCHQKQSDQQTRSEHHYSPRGRETIVCIAKHHILILSSLKIPPRR